MGENSKIEWTDHTFNPWMGCTKVSEGCTFCYAEELMDHRYGKVTRGPQGTRVRTSAANWRKPLQWDKQAAAQGWRYRVFCASLADVFEDRPDLFGWRRDLFSLLTSTPHLDWLLLTKRPENIMPMLHDIGWFIKADNVWFGTTVENQEQADKRIPHLLSVPAKVRFLSCEPLLGPVDLRKCYEGEVKQWSGGINWVICGGESGQGARPMHPEWARSLRDQCQAAGVPYFFKQWGEWADMSHSQIVASGPAVSANGNVHDWMRQSVTFADNTERTIDAHSWTPHATNLMYKVGKQAAGNLLDGVEYQQFPD